MNRPRILVVENEAIVAADIQLRLEELGYDPVGHAMRGEHAIALAGDLRPDLVLMDIQLAGAMDGITAAQAIRTQFSVPVVFLTAFAEEDTLARAKFTEPFGYILKPFAERELRTVIEMALYKHRAESLLRDSEARYRAMIHAINDAIVSADRAGRIVGWNAGAERMFGYSEAEVRGQPVTVLLPARYHDRHLAGMGRLQAGGGHEAVAGMAELEGRRKDGSEFPLSLSVSEWQVVGETFVTAIIHDITEHKAREREIERLNLMYFVSSHVSQAIVRAKSQDELFHEVCRVMLQFGRFKIAWIGLHDPATQLLVPVAIAGDQQGYVTSIGVSADAGVPEGLGPGGTAFRESRIYVCNDFFADPATLPWRERAAASGIQSLIALPLRREDEPVGLLMVYAEDKDLFGAKEVALLEEAVGDVSFALDVFASEAMARQAEAALRKSEARLSLALDTNDTGVWDLDLLDHTAQRTLLYDRIFGYETLLPFWSYEMFLEHVLPEDRPEVDRRFREAVATQSEWRAECRIRRRDGEVRWILTVGGFERNPEGTPTRMAGLVQDITERRRAEETVARLNEQHELILSSAAEGILGLDEHGNHAFVNPAAARMLGYEVEELLGRPSHSTWHHTKPDGSPYPTEECQIYSAYRDGEVHRISSEVFWRKDGTSFAVEYASTPIFEHGRLTGAVVTFTEITERLQLEAQFRQAQKMESVGQLASGIAHDFNNLLTVINGTAELLLAQVSQDDPVHADVQEIFRAGERAATLTRQLLAFSRQQLLEPRVLNFGTVVTGMESLLRRLLGEDIDLVIVAAPGVGYVRADPGQSEQVITNLAVNARDAMPQGGRLTIETENVEIDEAYARGHGEAVPPGAYVRLTVTDTGVGMSEGTRARIFEPFFTTKGPGKGTGLGLSTVYGIIKQSQGFIWVYSEVGQGTSFRIYLPRVTEVAATAETRPAAAVTTGAETILLVEDNAGLRKLATRVLKPAGYTVLEAATGEEALAVLDRHGAPVHLLLTDVVMPGMSGRELAERLAKTHPAMKALYMSGYTADTIVRHGVLEAKMPFLHKPFTAASLLREVRDVLDSRT